MNEVEYTKKFNESIIQGKEHGFLIAGEISDGYHTFNELYYNRMIMFSILCNNNKSKAWKSKLHDDGTMFDDSFIIGITTNEGDFTYHYDLDEWDLFDVEEFESAPKWDGHTSKDVTRLLNI